MPELRRARLAVRRWMCRLRHRDRPPPLGLRAEHTQPRRLVAVGLELRSRQPHARACRRLPDLLRRLVRRLDLRPVRLANYQPEPTAARKGASSRTTGTTKAWLVGWRRTVVARTVMVGS